MSHCYKIFKDNIFAFDKNNNIMDDKFLGISGTVVSVMTPESDIGRIYNLQACPVTNTGFDFKLSFNGETVKATEWQWLPNAMRRVGESDEFTVESIVALPPDKRCAVIKITLQNKTSVARDVSLNLVFTGKARKTNEWMFLMPDAWKLPEWRFLKPDYSDKNESMNFDRVKNGVLFYADDNAVTAITSSIEGIYFCNDKCLNAKEKVFLDADGKSTFCFSVYIGGKSNVIKEISENGEEYENDIDKALLWCEKRTKELFSVLPEFKSDNSALEKLYYRSLVTYITNRWDNPDLIINPYYSTGANNGGCMCSYLWDYSGGTYLHPLVDPSTHKNQMEICLLNDLTKSFAIMPVDGKPCGNFYQINQEKIIMMVYYYVLHTGDIGYLHKKVGDKTIIDWMIFHALVFDDTSKPVELIDYGQDGVAHLELRHELQYRGVMPDLNARRYMNYMRVYELSALIGKPCDMLKERAEQLKNIIMSLWNENEKWFDFIWQGKRETRFTVQMFKFLTSNVINDTTKEKLLSHINESEFLSEYGLHSMSKLDPAYDVIDIDNGGGGICTEFAAVIIGQLYDIGKDELASEIFRRILWWGTKLPYLGDSCAAYTMLQREDTPLQCDISSTSCAQVILFNMIGLSVDFSGKITICPPKHHLAEKLEYTGFKLRGKTFDITINKQDYIVSYCGKKILGKCGETCIVE